MVQGFLANQGTQNNLLVDTTGGATGTLIPVMKLSIDTGGTYLSPWTGNIGTIGTVGLATIAGNINIASGTQQTLGTVGTVQNLNGGTLNLATIVGNLGTIGTIGLATVTGNLGTIGTIGLATVSGNVNISTGTINLATISGNLGTIGTVGLATIAGNLGTMGTIGSVIGVGSIGGLSNLPQGSIQVTAGTFRQDARTTQNILTYGTQVSGTAAFAATIIGSSSVGAGTSMWMSDVSIF
ncbi:MAG: hypothetical protein KGI08_10575, partial [Thaumarchaeota archaeon]|nr:hypothetical protein [Nitrososphaerota archaeon]